MLAPQNSFALLKKRLEGFRLLDLPVVAVFAILNANADLGQGVANLV